MTTQWWSHKHSDSYCAIGAILARLGRALVMLRLTVNTKVTKPTGTSVPIDYVLHIHT